MCNLVICTLIETLTTSRPLRRNASTRPPFVRRYHLLKMETRRCRLASRARTSSSSVGEREQELKVPGEQVMSEKVYMVGKARLANLEDPRTKVVLYMVGIELVEITEAFGDDFMRPYAPSFVEREPSRF